MRELFRKTGKRDVITKRSNDGIWPMYVFRIAHNCCLKKKNTPDAMFGLVSTLLQLGSKEIEANIRMKLYNNVKLRF